MEKYNRSLGYDDKEASASLKPINLELVFPTRVISPVYTGRKISGEIDVNGNESIKVMLIDSHTRKPVIYGLAASLKVKIVLVRGDFGGEIWTHLEFQNNIVVNLEKKKNLLLGDLSLVLENGSGIVGEIRIKHDNRPLKNVKFRLGAMVSNDCPYEIKEAITNIFEVKDRRNESKLSKSLSSNDWVWKIMNISKKGRIHERLVRNKILTVRDFLNLYYSYPQVLKEICQIKGRKWDVTVNHAKTSLFQNVHNAYGSVGSTSQQSDIVPLVDYDESNKFGDNCYNPHPCVHDYFDNMVVDCTFSTQDVEICDVSFLECEPSQVYQEAGGIISASSMISDGEGGGGSDLAKKRWMKLRATIWFLMVSFTRRLGRMCILVG